jgi:small multidrug resistance family-3 protein
VTRTPDGYSSPGAFRRALTDRLRAIATHSRWALPHLQRQFAYDRLLERLYAVDDGWIVKGAAALLARDLGVRATIDVDVYRARVREVAESELREAAGRDIGDWFRFEIGAGCPAIDAHAGYLCAAMSVLRSIALFALAALAEIGGAWMIWQGVREHRGLPWVGLGIAALAAYGFVATFQHDPNFGRILAAYGGVFVAGSLAWAMIVDGFRPDRYDLTGAAICLVGVAVIMYAPRPT